MPKKTGIGEKEEAGDRKRRQGTERGGRGQKRAREEAFVFLTASKNYRLLLRSANTYL